MPSEPLGTNLRQAYKDLIDNLQSNPPQYRGQFAKMKHGHAISGCSWTHHDLQYIAKGAPVILFNGYVGSGPFEDVSDGVVQLNVSGGYYATAYVDRGAVEVITEKEFHKLFMRPWTKWRRFRWNWLRHWT